MANSTVRHTIYHIVPRDFAKDGVADFQRALIERLEGASDSGIVVVPLTFSEAFRLRRHPGMQFHLQLPMQAWRKKLLLPLAVLWLRLRFPRARLLITIHEWSFTKRLRRLVNLPMLWLADELVCPTPDVRDELVSIIATMRPRAAANAALIPIGPNFTWRSDAVAPWPQPDTVGYFGLLYPAKLPFVMLEAMTAVVSDRPLKLVLVGDFIPHHRALRQRFADLVAQPTHRRSVDWRGYVEDPDAAMEILAGCSAFVLLNERGLTERNGSLLTCLQFGVPILTSPPLEPSAVRSQWLVDCLASGQLRLATDHKDPLALARDIEALLGGVSPGERPYAGFDLWHSIASAYAELYQRG